jgi:hypothetical protein
MTIVWKAATDEGAGATRRVRFAGAFPARTNRAVIGRRVHLEQGIAENIAAGMSEEEARHTALRTFGNPTSLQGNALDGWGWTWVELPCSGAISSVARGRY